MTVGVVVVWLDGVWMVGGVWDEGCGWWCVAGSAKVLSTWSCL